MLVLKFSERVKAKMSVLHLILVLSFVCSSVLGYSPEHDRHSAGSNADHYFRHQMHYGQRVSESRVPSKRSNLNTTHILLRHRHFEHPPGEEEDSASFVHSTSPPLLASSAGKHHLRHYNRKHTTWEQRVFPALRHQVAPTMTSTAPPSSADQAKGSQKMRNLHSRRDHFNLSAAMQSRLFDREGLYSNEPKIKHGTAAPREQHMMRSLKDRDEERNHLVYKIQRARRIGEESFGSHEDDDDDYYDGEDEDDDDDDNLDGNDDEDEDDLDEEDDEDADAEESNTTNGADIDRGQLSPSYNVIEVDESDENANRIDNDKIVPAAKLLHSNSIEQTTNVFSKPYIPGTLTRHKYETLGTHEAVKQSRKNHITNQQHHRALANAHATKIHTEATCKWPKPKVEKIQKDPSKMYVPHCTILHRCGDDTGCCTTDLKTCIAKRTQAVDLYFFVKAMGSKHGTIERHTFINHTECQCVDKSKHTTYLQSAPAFLRRATILDCNCPRPFEKVLQENGICRCDCSSGNIGCDWLKRGMEHFSMADRKCIIEGRCKPPTCEHGTYDKDRGRCPKKESRSFH